MWWLASRLAAGASTADLLGSSVSIKMNLSCICQTNGSLEMATITPMYQPAAACDTARRQYYAASCAITNVELCEHHN
jgi:hypothetical protein